MKNTPTYMLTLFIGACIFTTGCEKTPYIYEEERTPAGNVPQQARPVQHQSDVRNTQPQPVRVADIRDSQPQGTVPQPNQTNDPPPVVNS